MKKAVIASEIASEAGFDGVEIHAVYEGYLLDQFTISLFNRRNDKYGGVLEDRLNFPVEVVQEIKSNLGQDFPVTLRYSIKSYIKDWRRGGLPEEDFKEKGKDIDEGLKAATMLEKAGYDALSADAGKGVVIIDNSFNKDTILADTIIMASGLKANKDLYNSLKNEVCDLHLIGDARKARNILAAIWDAYEVARSI